jgi:Ca2+-binding EF-hand superfamily protein
MEPSSASVFEYMEAFAFFDGDRDGKINKEEFGKVLRALGHAPSEAELAALQRSVDRIYGGFLTFPNFVKVVSSIVEAKIRPIGSYAPGVEAALNSFNEMCRGSSDGKLRLDDLHMMLTRHGDALDEASFRELVRLVSPSKGINKGEAASFGQTTVIMPSTSPFSKGSGSSSGAASASAPSVAVSQLVDSLLLPTPLTDQ